ncbi:taste receptor type 2 member 16-like [Lampris incognitus]|uniref:taste receptor type 2 member 16-like n=1 Tax=Lampris incognitus TaxID=2546036 RepID=UPI0024B5E2AB|nr:taste receptor type 2 member 16-like [Lampris incognitus]
MFGLLDLKLYGTAILVLVGVLWNIFNLTATIVEQLRSGGIWMVAAIICSISLCNILLHIATFLLAMSEWFGVPCWSDLPWLHSLVLFIWFCGSCTSFWSTACLSLIYCIKVVSFSSPLFHGIKRNISAITGVIMALTLMTSCLFVTPMLLLRRIKVNESLPINALENTTCTKEIHLFPSWIDTSSYMVSFVCYLALLPLVVLLPTALRLVIFLCRHTISMQKNQNTPSGISSYLLVSQLTVALVGVYVTTTFTISLYYFSYFFKFSLSTDMVFLSLSIYCIASAVLQTASNRRLREHLCALFCNAKPPNTSTATI